MTATPKSSTFTPWQQTIPNLFRSMTSVSTRKRPVRRSTKNGTIDNGTLWNPSTQNKVHSSPRLSLSVAKVLGFLVYMACALVTFHLISNSPTKPATVFWKSFHRRLQYDSIQLDPAILHLQQQFPVHVKKDMEVIIHPGVAYSGIERIKVLAPEIDFPTTLSVPKFWNPPEFSPMGIRHFLGDSGKRILTPQEAQSIGSYKNGQETIFVSIASYRDSECRPTVESLFLRATHPDRIRVAVVDQVEPEDPKCLEPTVPCSENGDQVLCKYRHLIDLYEVRAFLMVGPVLARHIAHRMYSNEYFAMQVDAHVRFTDGWDDDIVSQWKSANNEMAVISTYLTDIAGSIDPKTHKSLRKERNMMCTLGYEGQTNSQRHLVLKAPTKSVPKVKGTPMLHPFWSAGFSFSRGHFIVQVPYDQHLPMVFQGEESSIAIRAFTYGYDFYAPERSVVFHIFAKKENIARRNRHKYWENETLYAGSLGKSMDRLVGITGMAGKESPQDYNRVDEELYGLGRVRDTDTFYRIFGIHPDTGTLESHLCSYVQEQMHRRHIQHLRPNAMGIDYDKVETEFRDFFALDGQSALRGSTSR